MMEVAVATGAIYTHKAPVIVTTNKPTPNLFTGRMSFLSPNQQCQSTGGKVVRPTALYKLSHLHYTLHCIKTAFNCRHKTIISLPATIY